MGRGKIRLAYIRSSNKISLNAPYEGEQRATLSIIKHPQGGSQVYISIERGQLLESDYNEKVRIRFDEGKLLSFATVRPSDHSTETLFLRGAFTTFINQLKTAKTLKAEVPVYQGGDQVFVFNVAGFTWKQ